MHLNFNVSPEGMMVDTEFTIDVSPSTDEMAAIRCILHHSENIQFVGSQSLLKFHQFFTQSSEGEGYIHPLIRSRLYAPVVNLKAMFINEPPVQGQHKHTVGADEAFARLRFRTIEEGPALIEMTVAGSYEGHPDPRTQSAQYKYGSNNLWWGKGAIGSPAKTARPEFSKETWTVGPKSDRHPIDRDESGDVSEGDVHIILFQEMIGYIDPEHVDKFLAAADDVMWAYQNKGMQL